MSEQQSFKEQMQKSLGAEKSLEEQIIIKAQQSRRVARYMGNMDDIVEEKIRQAIENGEFDNLAGTGKPLKFDENPYVPDEMKMAFKILKDNHFAPAWVELGKEIDADEEAMALALEKFLTYCEVFWSQKQSAAAIAHFDKRREKFIKDQAQQLRLISRKIIDYNLQCPTFRLGRPGLDIEKEQQKIVAAIDERIAASRRK